jgi:hypothetical protein
MQLHDDNGTAPKVPRLRHGSDKAKKRDKRFRKQQRRARRPAAGGGDDDQTAHAGDQGTSTPPAPARTEEVDISGQKRRARDIRQWLQANEAPARFAEWLHGCSGNASEIPPPVFGVACATVQTVVFRAPCSECGPLFEMLTTALQQRWGTMLQFTSVVPVANTN